MFDTNNHVIEKKFVGTSYPMRYGSATNTGLRSLYNIHVCHKLKRITAEVKKFNDMSIVQIAHMSSSFQLQERLRET